MPPRPTRYFAALPPSLSVFAQPDEVYTETVPMAIAGAVATGFKGRGKAVKLKVNREASEDIASTPTTHLFTAHHNYFFYLSGPPRASHPPAAGVLLFPPQMLYCGDAALF